MLVMIRMAIHETKIYGNDWQLGHRGPRLGLGWGGHIGIIGLRLAHGVGGCPVGLWHEHSTRGCPVGLWHEHSAGSCSVSHWHELVWQGILLALGLQAPNCPPQISLGALMPGWLEHQSQETTCVLVQ